MRTLPGEGPPFRGAARLRHIRGSAIRGYVQPMSEDDRPFTARQPLKATQELRSALNLPPEQFGAEQFVGMISEEIEQLRAAGRTDSDISQLLTERAGVSLSADSIGRYFVESDDRRHPHN